MSDSALTGLRVLDFSWVWAGPICTMLLADMGAEVIKIESNRRLDTSRIVPPFPDSVQEGVNSGGQYNTYNRNKKSCTLDLTKPEAVRIAMQLVKESDVVVENFSAGVMTRLGLDYDACRAIKPDIIYLSLSGYGATGPSSNFVSYGMQLQAFSGLASLTGYADGPPRNLGTPISDTVGGLSGALGILAALHHQHTTGEGQFVDVSQCEALVALCPEAVLDYILNGRVQEPAGNRDSSMAPHGVYRCKGENNWVAIAITTDEEWKALCETIGRPELPGNARFLDVGLRYQNQDELDRIISEWTVNHGDYEAMHILQGKGVPATAVLSNAQLVRDPHLVERGFNIEDNHPVTGKRTISGFSWHLSRTPGQVQCHAPLLGQHNEEVLCGLPGMSRERFKELVSSGVIY
ncbi:MAG TPA: CoA transferase [Dehalococcoidia bacterium]|nr:CoA transferase [Dehalococcoidia bacterium]